MCTYSMVIDSFIQRPIPWQEKWIKRPDNLDYLNDLIKKAKKYDEMTGQPDCELDEKKQLLKDLADKLGVEIKF